METVARIMLELLILPGGVAFLLIFLYQFSRAEPPMRAHFIWTETSPRATEGTEQHVNRGFQVRLAVRVYCSEPRAVELGRTLVTNDFAEAIRRESSSDV